MAASRFQMQVGQTKKEFKKTQLKHSLQMWLEWF